MLETLYKKGYLDCTKIILDNAKPLGLNAEEAFVLIKILENYRETKKLSLEQLQENMKKLKLWTIFRFLLLREKL